MAWTEGTILGEGTTLVAELDRADARVLWYARDDQDRDVMVEVARPGLRHARGLLSFHEAAEAAIALRHPSLIRVIDHGLTEQGLPYTIRESMPADNVLSRVCARGPLGLRRVARIVEQLLRVLDLVHPKGLARGGVTPDRVFMVDNGVKLWIPLVGVGPTQVSKELGCAAPERLTRPAPERELDPRASLWEVAAMAYFALTASAPFAGEPDFTAAVRAGAFPRVALRGTGGEASRIELEGWLSRALAADPEDRFPDARAMLDAWSSVVGGLLLFVDQGEIGLVERLPSILDDDDEDTSTAVDPFNADPTRARDPRELLDELTPVKPAPERAPVSRSPAPTHYPLTRTVPPESKKPRTLGPWIVAAGIGIAAVSSQATSQLASGRVAGGSTAHCATAAALVAAAVPPSTVVAPPLEEATTPVPSASASSLPLPVVAPPTHTTPPLSAPGGADDAYDPYAEVP